MALADRKAPVMPKHDPGFVSLFPLPEMLGELLSVGPKSRKVQERQSELVRLFGSEMDILHTVPESDLRQHWDALGEAVARMRRGDVIKEAGFDGEYGVVKVFSEEERKQFVTGRYRSSSLLDALPEAPKPGRKPKAAPSKEPASKQVSLFAAMTPPAPQTPPDPKAFPYSEAQQKAIQAGPNPVLVLAGPGSGKTRTLVGRVQRLLKDGIPAQRILAVTFTRRAAAELRERLERALGEGVPLPQADTLHALALSHWSASAEEALPAVLPEETARSVFAKANALSAADARRVWDELSLARERLSPLTAEQSALLEHYHAAKRERNLADYTDLLEHWLARLQAEPERQWTNVLVDEIQDLSPLQVALVRALVPGDGHGFFGIGDPDQAIYGFRGAHPDVQSALREAWPSLESVTLAASHRSAAGILTSASALLGPSSACGKLIPTRNTEACLHLFSAPDARKEAAWVADQVALLLGGTSHTLEDSRRRDATLATPCSPGEVAVLGPHESAHPASENRSGAPGVPCSGTGNGPFWGDPSAALILELAGLRFQRPFAAPEGPGSLDVDVPQLAASLPEQLWQAGPSALASHLDAAKLLAPLFTESAACNALLRAFREQGKTWEGLLDWVCLRQDLDLVREQAEQVQIMTLHAAKGLEFRAVFLPALEEGILPFPGADALLHGAPGGAIDPGALAEERRLFYVGLTRAQDAVFVSHAAQRHLYGKALELPPSRFLSALPELFRHTRLVRHVQTKATQMKLF